MSECRSTVGWKVRAAFCSPLAALRSLARWLAGWPEVVREVGALGLLGVHLEQQECVGGHGHQTRVQQRSGLHQREARACSGERRGSGPQQHSTAARTVSESRQQGRMALPPSLCACSCCRLLVSGVSIV